MEDFTKLGNLVKEDIPDGRNNMSKGTEAKCLEEARQPKEEVPRKTADHETGMVVWGKNVASGVSFCSAGEH